MKMSARSEKATAKFLSGYNCAQSVLYSFCNDLRLDGDAALRLACGFGAGMGRKQEVCGAITGGIIAIGLRHGRGEREDRSATEETYRRVRELMTRFEARHGSCICRTLLGGCDLGTAEGQQLFKERDLLNRACAPAVRTVVETLEEIL